LHNNKRLEKFYISRKWEKKRKKREEDIAVSSTVTPS
jgi:hypothetical protein